ncbi:hypothetical protein HUO13_36010 [Saccharopolyspora erythraea]|uniref:hypothetical protein n=1 Tax=Saccharopolyspora erythraea TaxID=1836 RepID=UPI001BAA95DF|nr:hypothetical protein [Saccharopolyspora erythraea]QUH05470.1 hypothetical protein HUO13_36010 [Saccharopolyspora erythraea]
MDPELLREGMRTAVADEPPLGFDPDDVVAEAAHRQRRRRTTAAAVAAVVVAVVAGLVPAWLTDSGLTPAAPPAARPVEWPPKAMAPLRISEPELAARAARLEADLTRMVSRAVPDSRGFRAGRRTGFVPAADGGGSASVNVSADFVRPVTSPGVGTAPIRVRLETTVYAPGAAGLSARESCAQEDQYKAVLDCRSWPQSDGSLLVDVLTRFRSEGTGTPVHDVYHFRTDGSAVLTSAAFATAEAGVPAFELERVITSTTSEPAMSSKELATLATDPLLTLSR